MTPLHPLDLFRSGHDTAHIALMLGLRESEVYNRMAKEREARWEAAEKKRLREEEVRSKRHGRRDRIRDLSLRFIERRKAAGSGEARP